jgi:V8-like Glu-specific endopeptidase
VALVAAAALLAACGPAPPQETPTAVHFDGIPTVGPLFPPHSRTHICTASVVASPGRDLLLTAAHCLSGTGAGWTFAPGAHGHTEPFGTWTVLRAYGAPGWIRRQDQRDDFAFLVVAPQTVDGRVEQIQDVTGADALGTAPRPGDRVTVPAYDLGSDDRPVTCSVHVYEVGAFPAFDCSPYPGGTSGAPWLAAAGRGTRPLVVGVIGGLHQGGCHVWTSYSPPFGPATAAVAARAAGGGAASTFPPAGSDGC